MLHGREKVGQLNVNWQEYALGHGKTRRKTIGFGSYDKKKRKYSDFLIHIRELSILDAGLGCAIWDAAIILSRWIHANQTLFIGQIVLELGSGCALAGIVAARYAGEVYLTDYIPQVCTHFPAHIHTFLCNTLNEIGMRTRRTHLFSGVREYQIQCDIK
jgi:hypothetical protein